MQISGLLDIYFDAAVVFVTSHSLFFRLALAIPRTIRNIEHRVNLRFSEKSDLVNTVPASL